MGGMGSKSRTLCYALSHSGRRTLHTGHDEFAPAGNAGLPRRSAFNHAGFRVVFVTHWHGYSIPAFGLLVYRSVFPQNWQVPHRFSGDWKTTSSFLAPTNRILLPRIQWDEFPRYLTVSLIQ